MRHQPGGCMGEFIKGVLVENEAGAIFEGHVYDRFLKLRLLDGQILDVFDQPGSYGPISTGLSIGEIYEMVLITLPVPRSVQYFPTIPLTLTSEIGFWQGEVIEPRWIVTERNYKSIHKHLSNREWMLLATNRGQMLMNPASIQALVSTGGFVQWQNMRLDLLAVL